MKYLGFKQLFYLPANTKYLKFTLVSLILGVTLTSCMKEDEPIKLPEKTGFTESKVTSNIYDNEVFFDCSENKFYTTPFGTYDLAFETAPNGYKIVMNTGNIIARAWNTNSADWSQAFAPEDKPFILDRPNLDPDSLAFSGWFDINTQKPKPSIYIIDRGESRFKNKKALRFFKIQIVDITEENYKIRYASIDENDFKELIIPKNKETTFTYFSFDNGGEIIKVAPPKDKWDIVFKTYVHFFPNEPIETQNYLVRGILLNTLYNTKAFAIKTNFEKYPSFENFEYKDLKGIVLTNNADEIGYDWKVLDSQFNYKINPKAYYIINDFEGNYYKLRFIDFYGADGEKGFPYFEYEKL